MIKGVLLGAFTVAALAVATGAAFAEPAVATSSVNVRSGPGGNFKAVAKLYAGEEVEVNECQKGWCFVERQGTDGWVSASYLQGPDDFEQAEPLPKPVDPQVNFGLTIGADGKPSVSIGVNQPKPFPKPLPKPLPKPEPTVCFYDKQNFSGKSFCVDAGESMDSLPGNWDDRISSIEVLDGASVDVCTEEDAFGYCTTLTKSRAKLNPKLDDDISSFESY